MEGRTISTVEEADETKAGRERKFFGGIKRWPGTRYGQILVCLKALS
jgi:hypothetical protein